MSKASKQTVRYSSIGWGYYWQAKIITGETCIGGLLPGAFGIAV